MYPDQFSRRTPIATLPPAAVRTPRNTISGVWQLLVIDGIYIFRFSLEIGNWISDEVEIFKDLALSDCRPTV